MTDTIIPVSSTTDTTSSRAPALPLSLAYDAGRRAALNAEEPVSPPGKAPPGHADEQSEGTAVTPPLHSRDRVSEIPNSGESDD